MAKKRTATKGSFKLGEGGRGKEYKSPLELQKHIDVYFNNPEFVEIEEVSAGRVVKRKVQKPFTIEGLASHLGIGYHTLRNYEKKEGYEAFFTTITHAKEKITQSKIEGGLLGTYNAAIVKFDLINNSGYREKSQQDITTAGESLNKGLQLKIGNKEINL